MRAAAIADAFREPDAAGPPARRRFACARVIRDEPMTISALVVNNPG